jgi:hypothetical protein
MFIDAAGVSATFLMTAPIGTSDEGGVRERSLTIKPKTSISLLMTKLGSSVRTLWSLPLLVSRRLHMFKRHSDRQYYSPDDWRISTLPTEFTP